MASDGKQVELWKAVVTIGGLLTGGGLSILLATRTSTGGNLETYGLVFLIGGLSLVALGLLYAFWQQHEWKRPPKLPRGLSCHHFPLGFNPDLFPHHPHFQDLAIGIDRRLYPPDFRIVCSAPIRELAGSLTTIAFTGPPVTREMGRFHTSIDAVSVIFSPLQPIDPPSLMMLKVFSDEPIRVRYIKKLKTKYHQVNSPDACAAPHNLVNGARPTSEVK